MTSVNGRRSGRWQGNMCTTFETAGLLLLLLLGSAETVRASLPPGPNVVQSYQPLQAPAEYTTGLQYKGKGLGSAPNATRRGYGYIRRKRDMLANLGAGMNASQIAQEACNTTDILDPDCIDVLLLALTPAAYSSNNTADTPGRLALISPAQKQGDCSACVGFAVTAAAEAAVNVYKQQSWQKLNLSEQDFCFCKLLPRVSCYTGASFDAVLELFRDNKANHWASRDCFKFTFRNNEDCFPVSTNGQCSGPVASQLPLGGRLSVAYNGNALSSLAMVKEQIMLNGGVFTSMALSGADFVRFVDYKAAANGVFTAAQCIPADTRMHAVFCYGWWDNPRSESDGYWLCKNSWSETWGLRGSFKIAYGSAYIMQPDYTFALQYTRATITSQATQIKQKLKQGSLARDASTPGCVLYTAQQRIRLVKLTADLTTLAFTTALPTAHMRKAEVLSELVASNLGHMRNLSATSRGPFRLCGRTAQLLSSVMFSGDPNNCAENAGDPACQRCARQVAVGSFAHTCVMLFDGSVECAGSNTNGELGLGRSDEDKHLRLAPATVLAGVPISSVGAGGGFTCVLVAPSGGNKVYCFGYGGRGELGDGLTTDSVVPVAVKGLRQSPRIKQLAVGPTYACVVYAAPETGTTRASVQCWGEHFGNTLAQAEDLADSAEVTALSASWLGPCAVLRNRTAVCWHQTVLLGGAYNPKPNDSGLTDVESVSMGGWEFVAVACATLRPPGSAASLWCWGHDGLGKDGGVFSNSSTPWKVPGLWGDAVHVAMGGSNACVLVDTRSNRGGEVYCWGANNYGQLGQGYTNGTVASYIGSTTPLRVKGLGNLNATALFGGDSYCAITAAQRVMCWGANGNGMLGVGSSAEAITMPAAMPGLCA